MITWNTDVNAPCCPGEILGEDCQSVLIQSDWDYPSTAETFGWSLRSVQQCRHCGRSAAESDGSRMYCGVCDSEGPICDHDGTDGTVECPDCGVAASDFISAAGEYLSGADGAVAEDPGYFGEE